MGEFVEIRVVERANWMKTQEQVMKKDFVVSNTPSAQACVARVVVVSFSVRAACQPLAVPTPALSGIRDWNLLRAPGLGDVPTRVHARSVSVGKAQPSEKLSGGRPACADASRNEGGAVWGAE